MLGISHQLHCSIIHIHVVQFHLRIILCNLCHGSAPQLAAFQNVCLINAGNVLIALHSGFKGLYGNAFDFKFAICFNIIRFFAVLAFTIAALPEINAACQLSDNQNIQTVADDFRLDGACVAQSLMDDGRAQVCIQPQTAAQLQQSACFGAEISRQMIPFRAANRTQENRVAVFAGL